MAEEVELYIFRDEDCPPCDALIEKYHEEIEKGVFKIMDIHEAAKKFGEAIEDVETVPMIGIVSGGKLIYKSYPEL